MVENVLEDALECHADVLRDPDVLRRAHVHIPVAQAIQHTLGTVPVIYPDHRVTPVVNLSYSILENIDGQPG